MVEVGDARDRHMTAVLELTQQVDERDRVGSARERDDHTSAGAMSASRRMVRRTEAARVIKGVPLPGRYPARQMRAIGSVMRGNTTDASHTDRPGTRNGWPGRESRSGGGAGT